MALLTNSVDRDDLVASTLETLNFEGELAKAAPATDPSNDVSKSVVKKSAKRVKFISRFDLGDDSGPVRGIALPEELWSAIIENIPDDKATLLAISTVSRPFCRMARPSLFRSLVIRLCVSNDTRLFISFLESHPHLARVVRVLSLRDVYSLGRLYFHELERILANLPRLKDLDIAGPVRCLTDPSTQTKSPTNRAPLFLDTVTVALYGYKELSFRGHSFLHLWPSTAFMPLRF
ncbi:hypothetical protein EIP91_000457 [Steccherinum ochraceum]|uniref:F-box domain-containing protein n=1 Tax=Steccherinum ochraceum TaxID=92696 RepID=A0A4V2MWQ1_9APHY|nr:hypothetical protein EIP91_000457 [Steccherinum ochraceum]